MAAVRNISWWSGVLVTIMRVRTQKILSYASSAIFRKFYSLSVGKKCSTYVKPTMIVFYLLHTYINGRMSAQFIICPIAITHSMEQMIKSFCVYPCVCVCVCPSVDTLTVAFLRWFLTNWTQTCKPPKVKMSSLEVNIAPPFPLIFP